MQGEKEKLPSCFILHWNKSFKTHIDYISIEGRGLLVLASVPLFNLVRLGYNFRSHVSSRRATVFLLFLLGGKHSQPRGRTRLQEMVWNLISLWLSPCSVVSGIEWFLWLAKCLLYRPNSPKMQFQGLDLRECNRRSSFGYRFQSLFLIQEPKGAYLWGNKAKTLLPLSSGSWGYFSVGLDLRGQEGHD